MKWWGTFDLPDPGTGRWGMGPLDLWIARHGPELRVVASRGTDFLSTRLELDVPSSSEPRGEVTRYAIPSNAGRPVLVPVLADRQVVARPDVPTTLPPGAAARFYVSTPVFVQISVEGVPDALCEVPTVTPSLTWFGPSTREGALCYATKVPLTLDLDELPRCPHRAITPVRVRNDGRSPLIVERLHLPLPSLAVWQGPGGRLWTTATAIEREGDDETATVRISEGPPEERGKATLVAAARHPTGGSGVVRALGALFRGFPR